MSASTDYHGHPNYFAVYVSLVLMLLTSILIGVFLNARLGVALIFGIAVLKAGLVIGNFMHLRWEPRLLWGVLGFAVLAVAFAFLGIFPDLVLVKQVVAR